MKLGRHDPASKTFDTRSGLIGITRCQERDMDRSG